MKRGERMTNTVRDDYVDPVVFGPRQLVSSSKLVRSLGTYLDQTKKRPVFIMRDQEVEAVLINIEEYRELLEKEAEVEELYDIVVAVRRLAEHLQSGDKFIEFDDIMKEFNLTREDLAGVGTDSELED
jgi:PHD/YefM family antitoxin component YafN of YafNO toxin-antitoxin module